jgi:hypothetical protein
LPGDTRDAAFSACACLRQGIKRIRQCSCNDLVHLDHEALHCADHDRIERSRAAAPELAH